MSKQATPDQQAQVVILREAGYTLTSVAERTGLSVSSVQRIARRNGVVAGATKQALVDQARQEMIHAAFDLEEARQHAAALALDDLSLCRQIRTKAALALESLDVSAAHAPLACRALVALSTATKLTQDVQRRALPLEQLGQAMHVEEMSELRVRIMGPDDVEIIREKQRREVAESGATAWVTRSSAEDDEVVELT